MNINKSIAEEYIFNKDLTVGGYPISNIISESNETNKLIGGGDILENEYVNHTRFENLVLPVGLAMFSIKEIQQIGGYQTSQSSRTKSTIEGSVDPDVHGKFIEYIKPNKYKYNRSRETQANKPHKKNESKKKSKN